MNPAVAEGRTVPGGLRCLSGSPVEFRVMPSLHWHRVTEDSQRDFFDDTRNAAPEADRIGDHFRRDRPLAQRDGNLWLSRTDAPGCYLGFHERNLVPMDDVTDP